VKPEQEAALARFNRDFRVVDTSLLSLPRDLSDKNPGEPLLSDCQSYARTVKRIIGAKFPRSFIWRVWSPQNGRIPRHAVLWVKGKGYIDSTERKWRDTPAPHRKAWPVGTVPVVGLVVFLVSQAWARGWW
jgi:hypothetical protein